MEIEVVERRLREDPGDLASWDVYGEWLSGRGDARGELIRLERRRARVSPRRRGALDREVAALEEKHRDDWDGGLPPTATVLERRFGFASRVAVEWSDDAPVAIEQVLRSPFVTGLRVRPPEGSEDHWDDGEGRDEDGDPLPAPFVETGGLATLNVGRLTELDLSYLRIGALGARTLAVSALLRGETGAPGRLEVLDLRYCFVGDSGLNALAESAAFNGVRRLHLQRNHITADGVAALHRFENLTELDLRYCEIGAEGVRTLLDAPFAGSLRRLLLHRADVGTDGARLLAHAPQLPPALRVLWRCP
ncbi:leucine-rich repeat domain-containing protein [Actinomadura harenae]|uniref:hypothetical protein n=1 Tax=Actinomadura harenae TaxID=2483351 RepID=UPI0011C37EA2|nr:hypothetical protein [Actinomadura harenae]